MGGEGRVEWSDEDEVGVEGGGGLKVGDDGVTEESLRGRGYIVDGGCRSWGRDLTRRCRCVEWIFQSG